MPTFVLKKYEAEPPTPQGQEGGDPAASTPKEETIKISTSVSIGEIVAKALYKAMPNVNLTEVEETSSASSETSADTQVVSTEEINADPAAALAQIRKGTKQVLILNNGIHTSKEEWFLHSLENLKIKPFYTVKSFARHVHTVLG